MKWSDKENNVVVCFKGLWSTMRIVKLKKNNGDIDKYRIHSALGQPIASSSKPKKSMFPLN